MKRMYLALSAILLTLSASAQRSCDLEITGNVVSPKVIIDASGKTPTYLDFKIRNNGPDNIAITDTIIVYTPYINAPAGRSLFLTGISIASGVTGSYKDTVSFESGPADGTKDTLCDAMLLRSNAANPAADPRPANNIFCTIIVVENKSTSISDIFSVAKKSGMQQLSIVPNPANNDISFDFVAQSNTEVIARVIDLSGRVVLTSNYGKAYIGQTGFRLDVSSLTTGLYFVELNQDNVKAIGKLSKQ